MQVNAHIAVDHRRRFMRLGPTPSLAALASERVEPAVAAGDIVADGDPLFVSSVGPSIAIAPAPAPMASPAPAARLATPEVIGADDVPPPAYTPTRPPETEPAVRTPTGPLETESASFIPPSITLASVDFFCASLPARSISRASVTVEMNGSTTSPPPIDSITLTSSFAPPPKPPFSSPTAIPSRPSSASVAHTDGL